MASFDDYKGALASSVLSITNRSLYEKKLTPEDGQAIQQLVAQQIPALASQVDIVKFTDELAKRWPVFKHLFMMEQAKLAREPRQPKSAQIAKPAIPQPTVLPAEDVKPNIKDLEGKLLGVIIDNIESGALKQEDSQKIAQFILDEIDEIENQQDVIAFLQRLCQQWPIFNNILQVEEGKEEQKHEQAAAQDIAQMIKSGQAKQAVSAAQQIIQD